jgi:hypothetical protein
MRADEEDGVGFRRSRGRRSWLRLPIRTPTLFDATLRGRSEIPGRAADVAVEVNGRVVATVTLPPEWTEVSFAVPEDALRPGFNEVALVYAATPRESVPGYEGPDAAIALDWLRLTRRHRPDGPV